MTSDEIPRHPKLVGGALAHALERLTREEEIALCAHMLRKLGRSGYKEGYEAGWNAAWHQVAEIEKGAGGLLNACPICGSDQGRHLICVFKALEANRE